jgi:CcmD family protein
MLRVATTRAGRWIVVLSLLGAGGQGLLAQTTAPVTQTPAVRAAQQEPPDQFVPVKSLQQQDQLPAAPLLVAAYAFVWAVLFVYVWTIWRRMRKIEGEIQQLASRVGDNVPRH